uniref:Uncharacterized protein n=1 Tax=Vombatus ursinus TaxID=29139 RepID=A0A4X2JQV3_VOMUR
AGSGQSLRVPRLSYGKLQEIWGEPSECKGLRALSFRHCREKPHSRCLETSSGLPAGLDPPPHEIPTEGLADTEQLVQGKNQGKPRIQQRIWGNFVASLPGVTLSCSTCPRPPLDAAS